MFGGVAVHEQSLQAGIFFNQVGDRQHTAVMHCIWHL
jgi:hypothetical protein